MATTNQIKAGIVQYLDKEIAPMISGIIDQSAMKLCGNKAAQLFGVVSSDGSINVDILRDVAKTAIPETGIVVNLPLGASLTITRADIDTLHKFITEG